MTPTTETTAARLLEAVAEAQHQVELRKAYLTERIAADRAELAALGVKRVRAEKPRRGRPAGAKNRPKVATAPQMPLPAMEPNAAIGGE